MEKVYLRGSKVDWATEKVSLNKYFTEFSKVTGDCFDHTVTAEDCVDRITGSSEKEKILSLCGFTFEDDKFETLLEQCSPDNLAMEGENPKVNVDALYSKPESYDRVGIPIDVELKTFKKLLTKSRSRKDLHYLRLKYRNRLRFNCEKKTKRKEPDIKAGELFTVFVRVFFPFESSAGTDGFRKKASCSQEMILLSDETLSDLKDVIICMDSFNDAAGDVSDNPYAPVKARLRDVYSSSMFYIGNTFYTDESNLDNVDYSEVVRSWAAKRKISMNRVEGMDTTKIKDLTIRFGYPYLFQHLGDCEHLIVFSDARLLHQDDVCCAELYPLYVTLTKKNARYCYICKYNICRWIVTGSTRVPQDPSYVCNACFRLYFYKGKTKNGSFHAFHFFDRRGVI